MNKKTEQNPKGAGAKKQLSGGKRRNVYIDDESWKHLNSEEYDSASQAIRQLVKEKITKKH